MSSVEFALASPPTDGVSAVRFLSGGAKRLLVASSWDKSVRVYDCAANKLVAQADQPAPVLDCAAGPGSLGCVFGGLEGTVKLVDFNAHDGGAGRVVGQHEAAVRCVGFSPQFNAAVSASWDKTCALHDVRGPPKSVARWTLPGKAQAMCLQEWRIVVASLPRSLSVFDIRKLSGEAKEHRDSPHAHQTRSLAVTPDSQAFAVGSVDGRVGVECFQDTAGARKDLLFKCHRETIDNTETVYPVNALAFHPHVGTLATGGCDGFVVTWDVSSRKKLTQYHRYATSISSLAFSPDGNALAIAVSYTFEEGEKNHPPDAIMIRTLSDVDLRASKK
jgi:cell cycle arrest protein BUB3